MELLKILSDYKKSVAVFMTTTLEITRYVTATMSSQNLFEDYVANFLGGVISFGVAYYVLIDSKFQSGC